MSIWKRQVKCPKCKETITYDHLGANNSETGIGILPSVSLFLCPNCGEKFSRVDPIISEQYENEIYDYELPHVIGGTKRTVKFLFTF